MIQEKFKMKYFVTIVIIFLITAVLATSAYSYIQKKQQSDTDKLNQQISQLKADIEAVSGCSSSLKSYSDTTSRYSFSYPDNLKTDWWSDILSLTDIKSNKGISATVRLFPNNENLNLEQVSKKAPEDINSWLGDYQAKAIDASSVSYTNTKIDGKDAIKYTIAQKIADNYYSGYVIVNKGAGSRNEYYEIFGSSNCVLDQIVKSFKIL